MALALGVLLSFGIGIFYRASLGLPRWIIFAISWLALWALKVPLTIWYYGVRQRRFDYPVWGDSTGIPIALETMTWIAGAIISGIAILILMCGHSFSSMLQPPKPQGILQWTRTLIVACWLILLAVSIISGVWDGNEGMVIPCMGAIPLLLAVLGATRKVQPHPSP